MEEQGEGGKVLFPASLRDGLAGAISETVAKTLLAGTLWPGSCLAWSLADPSWTVSDAHDPLSEREL